MRADQPSEYCGGADQNHCENSLRPPCCGSGCAVCVLDYWTEDEFEPVTQEPATERAAKTPAESFAEVMSEAEMLAMLEAIEQAQQRARQIIAEMDG